MYKKWDTEYRAGWSMPDSAGDVNVRIIKLRFDGGVEHKDATQWALARVLPGFSVHRIKVSTAGLKGQGASPVKISLGCVSFERDCQTCEPAYSDLKKFIDQYDVSGQVCGDLPCGPWDCGDSCVPICCPMQKPADCCETPETLAAMMKSAGMADLVLTLHGTPAACTQLTVVIEYSRS